MPDVDESQSIRVGVNAAIIERDSLLVVTYDDTTGLHHNLPGGGVERGESIIEALHREAKEETSVEIIIDDFVGAIEYDPVAHCGAYGHLHKLEMIYRARLPPGEVPAMPDEPDAHQVEVNWIPLDDLGSAPLLPPIGETWSKLIRSVDLTFVDAERYR